jgi:hypothetical protein
MAQGPINPTDGWGAWATQPIQFGWRSRSRAELVKILIGFQYGIESLTFILADLLILILGL